jgi:protoheme IX farnesyltransferase
MSAIIGATPAPNPKVLPRTRTDRFDIFQVMADYWALTKPEVNFLIVITTLAGFCLGYPAGQRFNFLLLVHTLLGTLLVASGTATLNQLMEWRFDALMRRTARRPLPSGRVKPLHAFWFGSSLAAAGGLYLALGVNSLASALALLTLATYLGLYTPLKRRTPFCVLVGAIPGAMPPAIGWAAARGALGLEAWVLCAIVFLWQFPHFMAIAWMYREDYARATYLVLPQDGCQGRFVLWQLLLPSVALFPASVAPIILSHGGAVHFIGALVLDSAFAFYAVRLAFRRSNALARRLLIASVLYLPAIFTLLMILNVGQL